MAVAEEALIAMQAVLDVFFDARAPLYPPGELRDAVSHKSVDPLEAPGAEAKYIAFVKRVADHNKEFQELQKVRVLTRYYISSEAESQLLTLFAVRNELIAHAESAASVASRRGQREFTDHVDRLITRGMAEPDPIESRLRAAQQAVEEACQVHIHKWAVFLPFLNRRKKNAKPRGTT